MPKQYQEKFLDAVLLEDVSQEFLDSIIPVGKLNPQDVINVYRGDYRARMLEAIGKNFEGSWLLLGDEEFQYLANQFIDLHPSQLTSLNSYGAEFPEFLEALNVEADVVMMAKFELAFWRLFHAAAHPAVVINPDELDKIVFQLDHSLYLSKSDIKIYELWLQRENPSPELSLDDFEGPQFLIMFKADEKVVVKEATEIQFYILCSLKELRTIPALFSHLEQEKLSPSPEDWAYVFGILSYCMEL